MKFTKTETVLHASLWVHRKYITTV